ncbi:MAG: aldo/keto reductase [Opitutaceae bacterium]
MTEMIASPVKQAGIQVARMARSDASVTKRCGTVIRPRLYGPLRSMALIQAPTQPGLTAAERGLRLRLHAVSLAFVMKRRAFLKSVGTAGGGWALGLKPTFAAPAAAERQLIRDPSGLPRRRLGRTGLSVPVVGFPGLALSHATEAEGRAVVTWSLEHGCNYFDVAPSYGQSGESEIRLGRFLEGVPRDRLQLACKTKRRDAAGARQELERSLKRLNTDYFDVYQLHAVTTEEEALEALGPGGALEALLEARKEGKVRWLGFSSHSPAAALRLLAGHAFDTVMHPVNFVEHYQADFSQRVLDRAKETGAAVLAIKPIACGRNPPGDPGPRRFWYRPLEDSAEIALALKFSLSLDPVVMAVPSSFPDLFQKAVVAARSYEPATAEDLAALEAMARKYAPIFGDAGRLAASSPADGVPGLYA